MALLGAELNCNVKTLHQLGAYGGQSEGKLFAFASRYLRVLDQGHSSPASLVHDGKKCCSALHNVGESSEAVIVEEAALPVVFNYGPEGKPPLGHSGVWEARHG